MPTQLKLADVEQGIITVLKANNPLMALHPQVQGLSSKDWDDQGNIIINPPAVLILFDGAQDTPTGDNTRLTYDTAYEFSLICGATDLSSTDNERNSVYALLAAVRAAVAGQRIPVDGNTLPVQPGTASSSPVALGGIAMEQFSSNGAWYSQRIRVQKTAQFG
jgi:phage gp37-like protein